MFSDITLVYVARACATGNAVQRFGQSVEAPIDTFYVHM